MSRPEERHRRRGSSIRAPWRPRQQGRRQPALAAAPAASSPTRHRGEREQDRAQAERLAAAVQDATDASVESAYSDRGYIGEKPAQMAVVERSFACSTRFRRLARDDMRLPATIAGLHFVAFAYLVLHKAALLLASGL